MLVNNWYAVTVAFVATQELRITRVPVIYMKYVHKSLNTKENKSSVISSVVIIQKSDPVPAGMSQLEFQINNSNVEGGGILGSTIRIKFSHCF